jgi:hypothetical protein
VVAGWVEEAEGATVRETAVAREAGMEVAEGVRGQGAATAQEASGSEVVAVVERARGRVAARDRVMVAPRALAMVAMVAAAMAAGSREGGPPGAVAPESAAEGEVEATVPAGLGSAVAAAAARALEMEVLAGEGFLLLAAAMALEVMGWVVAAAVAMALVRAAARLGGLLAVEREERKATTTAAMLGAQLEEVTVAAVARPAALAAAGALAVASRKAPNRPRR